MMIKEFYDEATHTLTYVVHGDGATRAIVIDPVLDFDPKSGAISESSLERVVSYLGEHSLIPELCLETHAHADHLSGSQALKKTFPEMKVAINKRITTVQTLFSKVFNLSMPTDGSQFDVLLEDFSTTSAAGFDIKTLPTPGHTPACSSYLIGDALFTGDALFMPDYGVGRCDFPGGSSKELYQSIKENVFTLPDETRVFVGHDYQPGGRNVAFESSIGAQKAKNIHLNAETSEHEFIAAREKRDKSLSAPRLLLPSIQVNIMAGKLPEPEDNGTRYLKIPLKSR